MIIDHELKNVMRSHHDLEKDNAPYMKKAIRVCKKLFFVFMQLLILSHLEDINTYVYVCCNSFASKMINSQYVLCFYVEKLIFARYTVSL